MISTKWLQGRENISAALDLRKNIFCQELNMDEESISDFYDEFAFSLVLYEDDIPAGTGRLLFRDGKYFIDMVCVVNELRGRNYGDLLVRMLVRRAYDMGAEKTYASVCKDCLNLFENIGFEKVSLQDNGEFLMAKTGDVGGHCGKH